MAHVFISYKHEDVDFAAQVKQRIEAAGFEAWMDDELRAGEDWREAIDTAIRSAFACVVIMTPAAKDSEYVTYEWACAWGTGVPVIPVLLRRVEKLHPRLAVLQYLDFTDGRVWDWDSLIDHVNDLVWRPRSAAQFQLSVHQLLDAMRQGDTTTRDAIQAQLETMDELVISVLLAVLPNEPTANMRSRIVQILGSLKSDLAVPRLLVLLRRDPAYIVRHRSAEALGNIGDSLAVNGLIAALDDKHEFVRRQVAQALARFDTPEAIAALAAYKRRMG
ncbi:MAG: toll/interleukin-1 receptor domain-containing protein [Anaerolineae bacterium]|nr:toll/interleukin-1 receptor domain-containing protein [Anaerolineae bacterium]